MRSILAVPTAIALTLLLAAPADAQGLEARLGLGVASGLGSFADEVGAGATLRGELAIDLLFASAHLQAGLVRMSRSPGPGRHRAMHYGAGVRRGVGPIHLGVTAAWFTQDDDGFGVLPEVGVSAGRIEVVADLRPNGEYSWWSLRLGLRF